MVALSALFLALFAAPAFGNAVEVIISSKVLNTKDSKTMQEYVLKGNKVRVYSQVAIHAKGYSNRGLRQRVERQLPGSMDGLFERTDADTGLSVRYKPVKFRLQRRSIFCTVGSSPEFEVCHANYAVSASNAVDIPAGTGGEHSVTLQMLPPSNGLKAKMAKTEPKVFHVLTGEPALSRYSFTGMPQN